MQGKLMQVQPQPFIKLAQGHMELLTRFSSSPEVAAQAGSLFQQATDAATQLMQSGAFAQMMQGMLKNDSDFVRELNHGAMALMNPGQAALVQQVQEAGAAVIEGTGLRVRRSRQAA